MGSHELVSISKTIGFMAGAGVLVVQQVVMTARSLILHRMGRFPRSAMHGGPVPIKRRQGLGEVDRDDILKRFAGSGVLRWNRAADPAAGSVVQPLIIHDEQA